MIDTIEARVARGAAWLDEHYPTWWKAIDLSTLAVSSCHLCVLGQVYSGCIGVGEQDQILAQAMANIPAHEVAVFRDELAQGTSGGYNVLVEAHSLGSFGDLIGSMGFSLSMYEVFGMADTSAFALLTDEWTRVIISRRMHEPTEVSEILVPATVG